MVTREREGTSPPPSEDASLSELNAGRRRFTIAALIAIAITAVPFLWLLWSSWGPVNPLRLSVYQDNFYDLQARAMFHGHLALASGALGLEGFVHDGRTYTYFGLFPSIIRMPVLLVTSSLDGKLTASYMLLAWVVTGVFTSLLLWRVRFLVRGDAVMGTAEAASFGVLIATIMGGTIWMLLAATPFVFNEDIAWSICLTIGSIFALLGVVERPSWSRVAFSGLLILCANLDRATTGWACVVGAVLIAGWFALGFGGTQNRRWTLPLLGAAIIPLVVGCIVNYSKFGVLFGVSNQEQVWTHVNAYRRKFLAANHGAEEGLIFVPTNVLAYLRLDGLRFTSVFPFVTLPAAPPTPLGGVLFDRLYRTASLPSSTPLLFLLSIWGLVTAFRPRSIGQVARTRLLLLAAGSAGAALLLWGYIAPEVPRRLRPLPGVGQRRGPGRHLASVGGSDPLVACRRPDDHRFVGSLQHRSQCWDGRRPQQRRVGHDPDPQLRRSPTLHQRPHWARTGGERRPGKLTTLRGARPASSTSSATATDCTSPAVRVTSPFQASSSDRATWMPVERGHGFVHTFRITVARAVSGDARVDPTGRRGQDNGGCERHADGQPGRCRAELLPRRSGPASSRAFVPGRCGIQPHRGGDDGSGQTSSRSDPGRRRRSLVPAGRRAACFRRRGSLQPPWLATTSDRNKRDGVLARADSLSEPHSLRAGRTFLSKADVVPSTSCVRRGLVVP